MNGKYEITDIAHPNYPWLHRIRARRDLCGDVCKGDLGGYVESEKNLSTDPLDTAWIYDNAVCCGDACVSDHASLHDRSVAKDRAQVQACSMLRGRAVAEDSAAVCGGVVTDRARVSGCGGVCGTGPDRVPIVGGESVVFGYVEGNLRLYEDTVVLSSEQLTQHGKDAVWLYGNHRVVVREKNRDILQPSKQGQKEITAVRTAG